MATLNIKGLSDRLYRRLRQRARRNHRSMTQEVTQILTDVLADEEPLSLLDLRGLGSETWKDIEATRHVEDERSSWD